MWPSSLGNNKNNLKSNIYHPGDKKLDTTVVSILIFEIDH